MNKQEKSPIGSRWSPNSSPARVFVVIKKFPGGKVELQEEGRARFVLMYQRDLLSDNTRVAASGPDEVLDYDALLEQSGDALEAEIKSAAIDAEVARQVNFWESKLGGTNESL